MPYVHTLSITTWLFKGTVLQAASYLGSDNRQENTSRLNQRRRHWQGEGLVSATWYPNRWGHQGTQDPQQLPSVIHSMDVEVGFKLEDVRRDYYITIIPYLFHSWTNTERAIHLHKLYFHHWLFSFSRCTKYYGSWARRKSSGSEGEIMQRDDGTIKQKSRVTIKTQSYSHGHDATQGHQGIGADTKSKVGSIR